MKRNNENTSLIYEVFVFQLYYRIYTKNVCCFYGRDGQQSEPEENCSILVCAQVLGECSHLKIGWRMRFDKPLKPPTKRREHDSISKIVLLLRGSGFSIQFSMLDARPCHRRLHIECVVGQMLAAKMLEQLNERRTAGCVRYVTGSRLLSYYISE